VNVTGTHAKCQEGKPCHGLGCRNHTPKTARKQNWARPKPNQHEDSRVTATDKKGKR
jgi:hypothetical protein